MILGFGTHRALEKSQNDLETGWPERLNTGAFVWVGQSSIPGSEFASRRSPPDCTHPNSVPGLHAFPSSALIRRVLRRVLHGRTDSHLQSSNSKRYECSSACVSVVGHCDVQHAISSQLSDFVCPPEREDPVVFEFALAADAPLPARPDLRPDRLAGASCVASPLVPSSASPSLE
jgi:hypothetical protein